MISGRDRRVLDGIERDLRATDPDLCDRLSSISHPPSRVGAAVRRLISTPVIVGYVAVLIVALLLDVAGLVILTFCAVVISVSVRVLRAQCRLPDLSAGPGRGVPPFDT